MQKKTKTPKLRFSRKVLAYPYMAFLLVFVVLPLVLILINAFVADGKLSLQNFADFFTDSGSLTVLGNSLVIGVVTTLICLVIGYPVAYFLVKYHASSKVFVLMFILPMWVNFLIRTLSTKAIFLAINVPLGMGTVVFGMVYNYLPYMILPLHTTLISIDHAYIEAAEDLGADKFTVLAKTVLPLSVPGIISGITMTFIPAISTFAISELLSNRQIYLFGDSINTKFTVAQNFGVGSVMSLVMLVLVIVANLFANAVNKEDSGRSTL